MTSLQARFFRHITRTYMSSLDPQRADITKMRRRINAWSHLLGTAGGTEVQRGFVEQLPAEWLTPREVTEGKLLLYLHGGGYVMCGCATHRQLVSYIAKAAGVRALLPEYRLAPEHPFPAAVDDALAIYRGLLAGGFRPQDIIVAGDSAGGGLAMAALIALRDAGDPLPAAACLLSPWLDLTGSGESMRSNAGIDPWFEPEHLPLLADRYCRPGDRTNPLVSPVFADLAGLPPLYIQVCADELLFSDSTRIADKGREQGVDVELVAYTGLWHVFQAFARQVPESREAIIRLGAYIRCALG